MKRTFIILFASVLLVGCGNKAEEVKEAEKPVKEEEAVKEIENNDEEVEQEKAPLDEKIEINKTIELNGATIVIQSLRVKDDSTQLYGYWNHNSQYDKAHLDLLVTTTLKQNDEELEITNRDKLLDQKDKTIDGSLDLKIERIDNSPITLTFTANTDEREQELITIDIP